MLTIKIVFPRGTPPNIHFTIVRVNILSVEKYEGEQITDFLIAINTCY